MLRTSKRRRLSPDTCLPVLTRSELRWLDRSGPLNSCSWKEPVPSPSFSSDCHDALPNRHDPPYWCPDMGPKAPWSWVCGETQRSGPQRQKPNVKGWFPLAARVFGFPSKESGGGVGNPQLDRVLVSVSEWLLGSFVLILLLSICQTQPFNQYSQISKGQC